MGSKKTLPFYQLITNGVMAGTSTLNSIPTNVMNLDNLCLQVRWSGTPTGTFSVLGSNDNINFDALTFNPTLAQPSGSAGSYLIDLNQVPFAWLMVQYVNSAGSGVLNVSIFGKDLN